MGERDLRKKSSILKELVMDVVRDTLPPKIQRSVRIFTERSRGVIFPERKRETMAGESDIYISSRSDKE